LDARVCGPHPLTNAQHRRGVLGAAVIQGKQKLR
jgi:hypothetical protein